MNIKSYLKIILILTFYIYSGNQIVHVPKVQRRDTIVACIRGDGKRLGLFWIDHKRKGQQQPLPHQTQISKEDKISGMNLNIMKEWAQYVLQHMNDGDVLILDRLSSHLSKQVKVMFEEKGVNYLLLPPKGSLLMSPLDRGFFGVFEKKYRYQLNNTSRYKKDRKFNTSVSIYNAIPAHDIVNCFKNCSLDSSSSLAQICKNFEKEMGMIVNHKDQKISEFFELWANGIINIDGVKHQRRWKYNPPMYTKNNNLDGLYWRSWGWFENK